MIAELASPEQLQRHFSCTAGIADVTGFGSPVAALIEVEACRGVNLISPDHLSILGQDVGFLCGMQVGNTAATLIELVVPRDGTTGNQALRDEVEVLLQREVSEDTGDGTQLVARCGHIGR